MSKLEIELRRQLFFANLGGVEQFRAIPGRRFRWDFGWPDEKLLVEVQGGIWTGGKHATGAGITRDCEKQNLATLAGFRCLSVTSNQIKDGSALRWIQEALGRAA